MVIGQAEVPELVRDGEALVPLVADPRRIEDPKRSTSLEKATREGTPRAPRSPGRRCRATRRSRTDRPAPPRCRDLPVHRARHRCHVLRTFRNRVRFSIHGESALEDPSSRPRAIAEPGSVGAPILSSNYFRFAEHRWRRTLMPAIRRNPATLVFLPSFLTTLHTCAKRFPQIQRHQPV
jgi:hypothetical protein